MQHGAFLKPQIRMGVLAHVARRLVSHPRHAGQGDVIAFGEEGDPVARFARQGRCEMPELPRHVLVDEKDVH